MILWCHHLKDSRKEPEMARKQVMAVSADGIAKTNEESKAMPEELCRGRSAVLSANIEIVPSDVLSTCWNVVCGGEKKGDIMIDPCGEFNVSMMDGTDTYDGEWRLDSLRKAAAWAMEHLIDQEVRKGW